MKVFFPLLALLVLAGCQMPPPAPISQQEQARRDADHDAVRQERAQQEYWENERGEP
jgi:uncharacterized lipoprotein YajG